jgi:hypothetical protein
MTVETWAALIHHYDKPPLSLIFNGKQLFDAISRTDKNDRGT